MWFGAMRLMDTPPELIKFFDAKDGKFYTRESLVAEAIENGFDFYRQFLDYNSQPLGDIAIRYSLDTIMQEIIDTYECAAVFMDEYPLRVPYYLLEDIVLYLYEEDVHFSGLVLAHRMESTRSGQRKAKPIHIGSQIYSGIYGTEGDHAFVVTKQGARRLLESRRDVPLSYCFTLIEVGSQGSSGFYTTIPPYVTSINSKELEIFGINFPSCDRDHINSMEI